MSCDTYQEMVSVYIDYELDDESARTLFGHLSACAGCRQFLQKSLHFRTVASLLPIPVSLPRWTAARSLSRTPPQRRGAASSRLSGEDGERESPFHSLQPHWQSRSFSSQQRSQSSALPALARQPHPSPGLSM